MPSGSDANPAISRVEPGAFAFLEAGISQTGKTIPENQLMS